MPEDIWSKFVIFTEISCPQYSLSGVSAGVSLLKLSVSNWYVPQTALDPAGYEVSMSKDCWHICVCVCVCVFWEETFNRNILKQTIGL